MGSNYFSLTVIPTVSRINLCDLSNNSGMVQANDLHPTKSALLMAMVQLLETKAPEDLRTEDVLELAHVSKGSLYHHFRNLPQLLDAAQVYRYSKAIDKAVAGVENLINQARIREDMVEGMKRIAAVQQSEELRQVRHDQISQLAAASKNEELKDAIGREQERLTEALAKLFEHSVVRGWGNPTLDPHAAAVFARALTIGKIVDDVTREKMNPDHYLEIIDQVLSTVFFPARN